MNFIVSSFYTKDTSYELEIQSLIKSCQTMGIEINVNSYPSQKSWELNCWIKPISILNTMNQYPDRNVLYLDSDAVVLGKLDFLNTLDSDVACHILSDNWNLMGKEMLAGTLFLKNCLNVRSFISLWYSKIVDPYVKCGEFFSFSRAFDEYKDKLNLKFFDLPPEYAKIFDRPSQQHVVPLIQHNQASRRNKSIVNQK